MTISFIDNAWHDYDHERHFEVCARLRPKYATVRDAVTQSQAAAAGVEWYSLSQILDWADEMKDHAAEVIVIPKYDCVDDIPDRFMLGYSLPSSYGKTELPVEAFRGRRVHLLGGSWPMQRAALATLGDDVVSLDNNYIYRLASWGKFVWPDGSHESYIPELGLPVTNPHAIAVLISLGNIGRAVHELYPLELGIAPSPLDNIELDDKENERDA